MLIKEDLMIRDYENLEECILKLLGTKATSDIGRGEQNDKWLTSLYLCADAFLKR
jgi:hypothetical protein